MNPSNLKSASKWQRVLLALTVLWATCMFALAAIRAWQIYTPIPVYDMWHGYYIFGANVRAGDWGAWFRKYNEHWILLGRLLFSLDLHLFRGNNGILIGMNFIFAICSALMFQRMLAGVSEVSRHTKRTLSVVILGSLFLLCQSENLTWAFQGVYWLAYLLPLCAFYFLQKPSTEVFDKDFLLACIFGTLSLGTMGNGVVTLPLMIVFAIVTKQGRDRVLVLSLVSLAVLEPYLLCGGSLSSGQSVHDMIKNAKLVTGYLLILAGSPFGWIFNSPVYAGCAFGAFFYIAALPQWVRVLRRPRATPVESALVFFIGYSVAAFVAISCARLPQRLQMPQYHYTTTALFAWIALLILYSRYWSNVPRGGKVAIISAGLLIAWFSLHAQWQFLDNWDPVVSKRRATLLGVLMGVKDMPAMADLVGVGDAPTLPELADKAARSRLGIFRSIPYAHARERLGGRVQPVPNLPACDATIDAIETTTDPGWVKLQGSLRPVASGKRAKWIRIINSSSTEVGEAIMGRATFHLHKDLSARDLREEFRGYVLTTAVGAPVSLQGENSHGAVCQANVFLPHSFR